MASSVKQIMRNVELIFLFFPLITQAQPGLMEMVSAEKAFIEMARTQNRRDAFLHFLTDSAVTQGPNGPTKGKTRIAAQPVAEDLLSWEIAYSDIAGSGDFGFNTGPWNYHAKWTDEKPAAFGQFNSVWKKQADGTWKNVLDIGISHGATPEGPVAWTHGELSTCRDPLQPLTALDAEKNFLVRQSSGISITYPDHLSTHARMMVSGHLPFSGAHQLSAFIAACPETFDYSVLGSETASSHDMGYVYGTANCRVTKDGKKEIRKATYVRIWKRECTGWKIVLDVLSY